MRGIIAIPFYLLSVIIALFGAVICFVAAGIGLIANAIAGE